MTVTMRVRKKNHFKQLTIYSNDCQQVNNIIIQRIMKWY